MGGNSGIKGGLLSNSGTANGLESLYSGNAQGIGATLNPTLTAQAVAPSGYTPSQMASMTTAAEQTAGGENAGRSGGAMLRAARTGNIGSGQGAMSSAAQQSGQNLSQVNAGIQSQNANLAQKKQQSAESGLEGLYGTNVGAGIGALGQSTGALNDAGNLKSFWQSLLQQGMQSAGQAAAGGAFG